ncbi:MAG: hypothetical protein K6E86_04305 [Bacteroidales bacterium]|nr:hypothetical protein [Bacteroidales bacterium]
MKINRILPSTLVCLSMASLFVGCYDEYDDYEVGDAASQYNVTFATASDIVAAKSDNGCTVTLQRPSSEAASALTVELDVLISEIAFDIPKTVTFAAGDTLADLVITFPADMELNVPYSIELEIDDDYTNPYLAQESISKLYTTISKEDFDTYAAVTFVDGFWYGEEECEWNATVEYSPALDIYRVKDAYYTSNPLYFAWDKEAGTVSLVASDGTATKKWVTGLVDDDYGALTAVYVSGEYVAASKSIEFLFSWTVSDGSFGKYPVSLVFAE